MRDRHPLPPKHLEDIQVHLWVFDISVRLDFLLYRVSTRAVKSGLVRFIGQAAAHSEGHRSEP